MTSYTYEGSRGLTKIGDALITRYGAGNVTIHTSAAAKLIFTAAAICDKPIRLTVSTDQLLAAYGSGYNAGTTDIDDPVVFGGSSGAGAGSVYAVVFTDNTMLLNWITTSQNSKIILVGKLTNGDYAVLGCVGSSSGVYYINHFGFFTATDSGMWVYAPVGDIKTIAGKTLKQPLIVYDLAAGIPLTGGGVPAAFEGISVASRQLGQAVMHKGADYFISTSDMYDNNARRLYNSLLVEGIV